MDHIRRSDGDGCIASRRPWTLDRASRRTASYLCSLQIRKDTPLESRWELSVPPSYPWLSYRVRILHFPATYICGRCTSIYHCWPLFILFFHLLFPRECKRKSERSKESPFDALSSLALHRQLAPWHRHRTASRRLVLLIFI